MARKQNLTPSQQRETFARAYDTVGHYLSSGNFIGAYVVAFSILEDRINAMHEAYATASRETDSAQGQSTYRPLHEKVRILVQAELITQADQQKILEAAKERNHKLHAAMWNLDEFKPEHVDHLLAVARIASNARQAQKRRLAKAAKSTDEPSEAGHQACPIDPTSSACD